MKPKKLFKPILIALLLSGSVIGFSYAMSAVVKPAAPAAAVSGTPMVPASFSDLAEKVLQILTEVRTEQINAKLKALAQKVEQEAIDNKIADKNKEAKKPEDKKLTNGQIKNLIRQGLTNDKISELLKKEAINEFYQKNQ